MVSDISHYDTNSVLQKYMPWQNEESNGHLAYWISNVSTLLVLLQKSLKAPDTSAVQRRKPPPPTSFFGRMAQVFLSFLPACFAVLNA